ncbi:MAG: hypothetical protein IPP66_18620 [Anaerolineales bacterium]|nr:hypothetical protein [Anaerolineales bacterium]
MPFSPRVIFRVFAVWMIVSLAVLACSGVGVPGDQPAPIISPTKSVLATPSASDSPSTALPSIPERRRLTLEFPSQIRAGDSDRIRLTLEVDDLGNITPTAQVGGNVVTGDVIEIPNLYETHNVIAETKFDVAGMQVSPPELISQPLSKGQSINFYWSVRPLEVGVYRGTVWFYLRFVDKVSGEESRNTVSAQLVEIEAVNFLGLPAKVVRTLGGIGSLVGAVVGFPFFEDIVKFLIGRRKRKK